VLVVSALIAPLLALAGGDEPPQQSSKFARQNLVAWCIVPFDAAKLTPAQRAEMVQRLGLTKVAYDWRDEHVPTFEDEIRQYQERGLEFFAFWSWHDDLAALVRKYNIHPQIWITAPSPAADAQADKVAAGARELLPLVDRTRELGLQLGLYNHGGWGGEPANLVAVCERLRSEHDADHVGIVYNFHHGHEHIADFADALRQMQPYLLCLNLNGMNDGAQPKILPIGSGQHERPMMEIIRDSGYQGPVGIIHHREELDAETGLRQNLDGLRRVLKDLGDEAALRSFE
jgi:sugar phosphate isomerase/epimerase